MTTVTIHDDATRAAAWKALWCSTGADLGEETFTNLFHDAGWQAIDKSLGVPDHDDPGQVLYEKLAHLDAVRAAALLLATAGIGEEVVLPVDQEQFLMSLDDCVAWIEDHQSGFWQMGEARRQWVAQCRDAAARLLAELKPAEAVA